MAINFNRLFQPVSINIFVLKFWHNIQYRWVYQTHFISFLLIVVLGISTDCSDYYYYICLLFNFLFYHDMCQSKFDCPSVFVLLSVILNFIFLWISLVESYFYKPMNYFYKSCTVWTADYMCYSVGSQGPTRLFFSASKIKLSAELEFWDI